MSSQLRPFVFSDYAAARSLWEATPGVGLSKDDGPASIESFLSRNPSLSFVAQDGTSIVATALCGHDGRRGFIYHLAVAETHRRTGLGTQLLRRSLAALHSQGINKCHLMVFGNNETGLKFWRGVAAQERVDLVLFSMATTGEAP
jgi:ribosomal protein S18 acetylase RimI-like enzyme